MWERNVRKLKRLKGDEYSNCTGRTIQSKCVHPSPCIQKSNHESCLSFSENQRKLLFDNFYQLGDIEEQLSFIASSVKAESIELSRTKNRYSRRRFTNKYSFSVNVCQRIKVCKEFFMATLNVTDALIRSSLQVRRCSAIRPTGPASKRKSTRQSKIAFYGRAYCKFSG